MLPADNNSIEHTSHLDTGWDHGHTQAGVRAVTLLQGEGREAQAACGLPAAPPDRVAMTVRDVDGTMSSRQSTRQA